ncbi:restriction endonuclease subunit S [Mycobacterium gordonae]|nr:restriction endonuclease subunit S [Mycobacterium sp.]MCV7005594.1 restriction endonuclease subunit S [Mycobacterium gordonae]
MGEWAKRRLGDIIELRRGFDLPARLRVHGPYPVLSSGVTAGWHSEGPVKGPGFVVGRATNLGQPTWSDCNFWPLNTTLYAADFKGNHPKFLFHLFEVVDLTGFDSGSVQPMLNRNYIADVEVRVPDFETQKAIVKVLGALDDKIAANESVAKAALALADSLFEQARSSSEERTTIGELAEQNIIEFGDGYRTKRSEHGKPGLRILRAGDVRDFQLLPTGGDYVSADYSRQIGGKASMPGDVVMTTKGTVGRVAVVGAHTEQVVYSPQICYFRVRDIASLGVGCLAAWFRSPDLTSQTASLMYKSDMAPYINLRDIRSLSMPVFDPSVQHRQSKLQSGLLDRFDACCVENESLARTRDELLPLLMSGKLSVKAAETVASEVL